MDKVTLCIIDNAFNVYNSRQSQKLVPSIILPMLRWSELILIINQNYIMQHTLITYVHMHTKGVLHLCLIYFTVFNAVDFSVDILLRLVLNIS